MNTQKQIALIVALFFILVGGCAAYTVIDIPVRAVDQAKWHKDQSIERGALLFANNCRTCHGIKGEGGVGLPLNTEAFQNQDPLVLKNNITLLQRTLYCGRAGTRMPAWLNANGGSLNPEQIKHLINLITAPIDPDKLDEDGEPTNKGWLEAVEFAHNLNHETAVLVGGDTLGSIAKEHNIGLKELSDGNGGISVDQVLAQGVKVKLPVAAGRPTGRTYEIKQDRETLRKINDSQLVGALIIADLNGITYKVDEKAARISLVELDPPGDKYRSVGLIPGATLGLPAGATYVVRAGDTVQSVARQHGITESAFTSLNKDLLTVEGAVASAPGDVIDAERKLKLPADAVAFVQAGQTLAVIANVHGLTPEELATSAGLADAKAVVTAGQELKLPGGARYTVQTGDTLAAVAAAHKMSVNDLATLNATTANAPISPSVIAQLPKVDTYVVNGQDLPAIAASFSNVTAASLAEAQGGDAKENSIYAIGTQLVLPESAWGSAPPDAINNGSACVDFAVPVGGNPGRATVAPPTAPTTVSDTVLIESNANDFTVTADGTKQTPNRGAVLIETGTPVRFTNKVGLHTITINGTDDEKDWSGTKTKEITFNDAGEFKITCTIHPAMLAYVFVE